VSTYFTTQAQTLYCFTQRAVQTSGPAPHKLLSNKKAPWLGLITGFGWRRGPESNRASRICNPVHNRFVTAPYSVCLGKPDGFADIYMKPPMKKDSILKCCPLYIGAGEESRTLDLNLGKVALYQLSYSRDNSLKL
jgi:hypothetical protein